MSAETIEGWSDGAAGFFLVTAVAAKSRKRFRNLGNILVGSPEQKALAEAQLRLSEGGFLNFEIEFLPVGEASKAGDAIIVKYGDDENYRLMVIDGGNADSGKNLVSHVHRHYGQNVIVAHALLSHSDTDHARGFLEVLDGLDVRTVWMHLPWNHAAAALPYFADKSFTQTTLASRIRKEYDLVDQIYNLALSRQMVVREPFWGDKIGPFIVLSPSKKLYEMLVPQFEKTPAPDQAALEQAGWWIGKAPNLLAKMMDKVGALAEKLVDETWEYERLKEGGRTSAANESSAVLYGDFDNGQRALLTADAGHWALWHAVVAAENNGLPLQQFKIAQIPHHGSRSNVGPEILDRLLGKTLPANTASLFSAFVSAPKDDSSHPRKMVTNAFMRRGARVIATQGDTTCYTSGYKFKPGYLTATPLPFAACVEDYD